MDNVVPILTGERRRQPSGSVSVEAYNVVLDQHAETWRELVEVSNWIEVAEAEINRLQAQVDSERRRGPSRYWLYAACLGCGLLIGYLLGRAML